MVALATVPVVLVTSIAASIAAGAAETEIVKAYSSRMEWAVQDLDEALGRIGELFYSLQSDKRFAEILNGQDSRDEAESRRLRDAAFEALARVLYANPGLISSVSCLSLPRGQVLSFDYAAGEASSPALAAVEPWSRAAQERTSLYFSRPSAGGPVLACRPLRRFEDRALLGALAAKVDDETWLAVARILSEDDDGAILVLDSSGRILYGKGEGAAVSAASIASESLPAGRVISRRERGCMVFTASALEGRVVVAKFVPLALITKSARTTAAAGIWIGLLFALISTVLAVMTSRRLSAPIIALARRMGENGIPQAIEPMAGSHDEIAALEHSFNAMLDRIRDLVDSEYRRETELARARLDALQMRINPHYIHNTLNMIGGMALARGVPEIHSISLAVGKTLRYALEEGEELVPVEREIENARDYLYIQEQRFAGRFSAAIEPGDGRFPMALPRLSLQPILENCFEHGFADMGAKPWRIEVKLRRAAGRAAVIVRDNGAGMDRDRLAEIRRSFARREDRSGPSPRASGRGEGMGLGLANVDGRLKLNFGPEYGLSIHGRPGAGATVMLFAPLWASPDGKEGER